MNWISQAKADLKDHLNAAGYKALTYTPSSLDHGLAVIEPDAPYFGARAAFGERQLNLSVTLTFRISNNKTIADQADEKLAVFLNHVEDADWSVTRSEVGMVGDNPNIFGSAVLFITKSIETNQE